MEEGTSRLRWRLELVVRGWRRWVGLLLGLWGARSLRGLRRSARWEMVDGGTSRGGLRSRTERSVYRRANGLLLLVQRVALLLLLRVWTRQAALTRVLVPLLLLLLVVDLMLRLLRVGLRLLLLLLMRVVLLLMRRRLELLALPRWILVSRLLLLGSPRLSVPHG